MRLVQVASYIVAVVSTVSAQAPGDESSFCRTADQFAADHTFPPEVVILLDSYDYFSLNTIWFALNADRDSHSWGHSGGVCERLWTRSCSGLTQQVLRAQENWIFTQHVRYGAAKEVLFNITFNFAECRFRPCANEYVTVYIYQRNSIDSSGRTRPSNYQPLLSGTDSRLQRPPGSTSQITTSLRYTRPPNSDGFYLGIRDEGTCGQVGRLIAHYLVCLGRVEGLVTYPEIALPPQNSPDVIFDAVCASNADNTSSLQVRASSSGSCTALASGGPSCRCNAGYELSGGSTACIACRSGEYRTLSDTSCQQCPENTNVDKIAASVCSCEDGFYRTPLEGPEVGCTEPPTACRNLGVQSRTDQTLTISWSRPTITGRSDFFYRVLHSDPNDNLGDFIVANSELRNPSSSVTYMLTALIPFTSYTVRVTTHNGVSNQDSVNNFRRVTDINAMTREGVPSQTRAIQRLCTVVVWQDPLQPNGRIVGYDLDFRNSAGRSNLIEVPPGSTFYLTRESERESGTDVRVRARTSAGPGDWTPYEDIGCMGDAPKCPPAVCPSSTPCAVVTNPTIPAPSCTLNPIVLSQTSTSVTLMWNRISSSNDITYSITVIDPDDPDTTVLRVEDISAPNAIVTYTVTGLGPFTTYRLMLRSSHVNNPSICMIVTETSEGVPTAPARPRGLCTALVWRPPEQPNGVITGYVVRLNTGTVAKLDPVDRYYVIERSDRRAGVSAQVRAENGAGPGIWTDNFSVGDCSAITTITEAAGGSRSSPTTRAAAGSSSTRAASTSSSSTTVSSPTVTGSSSCPIGTPNSPSLFSDPNVVELSIVAVCSMGASVAIMVPLFVVIGHRLRKRPSNCQPVESHSRSSSNCQPVESHSRSSSYCQPVESHRRRASYCQPVESHPRRASYCQPVESHRRGKLYLNAV